MQDWIAVTINREVITIPYKRTGRNVYVKKNGKWSLKATAKSATAAVRMMNALRGVEHGWDKKKKKR